MVRPFNVVLLAALLLTGCQIIGTPKPDDDLEALANEIEALVGEARATEVGHCRHLAYGSKPCGGPWSYLVYSAEETDPEALQNLVDRYNRLDAERNRKEGRMSDCLFVAPPDLVLEGGQCKAAAPSLIDGAR